MAGGVSRPRHWPDKSDGREPSRLLPILLDNSLVELNETFAAGCRRQAQWPVVLPKNLSASMEGPAKSPRDLSCAAIDAEGTCHAARFWAKIASRTRQGGLPSARSLNRRLCGRPPGLCRLA
jgi:hypothetical protein